MKIILATPLFPPEIGGPATYTTELAERLHAAHELTIVAYASTSTPLPGVRLITVSKKRPLPVRLLKFFRVLWREAKGADVIYVQNAVAAGLPAMLVGKALGVPVVLKFVGDEAWERATQRKETTKHLEDFLKNPEGSFYIRMLMWVEGLVLRNVTRVTTPSAYLGEAICAAYGIPRERLVINYNATESEETPPFEGTVVPHQLAVTARLTSWKGVDGIIAAVAILQKEFPDVRLCVAGDGPEEDRLKALAKDLGVADRVLFMGRVSRAETWHLRKTSQVYVLNSTYEGLPHTVLTSFAAGIPVVATNISGTNEAVYDGESGLLVEPNNPEALAAAIARLFTGTTLAQKLVVGGTKILHEKFSWKAHIATLTALLESVVSKPGH